MVMLEGPTPEERAMWGEAPGTIGINAERGRENSLHGDPTEAFLSRSLLGVTISPTPSAGWVRSQVV